MSASLKSKAEQWVAKCMEGAAGLSGIPIAQIDSSEMAKTERIVVSATVGERLLEGARPYVVEVEVELFETGRDAASVDAIFAAIECAVTNPSPAALTLAKTLFAWLLFKNEEMGTAAERGRNTRHRSCKLPFQMLAVEDFGKYRAGETY